VAKVLLVEDDNNLREIFEMRLQAEGYQTATANNGEEALVTAMKEKPDLIVADVMMPKLSGFEMLETLRAAPEMQSTKVIMMTALGQAEDQARGEKLGVLKYLVKSQVTLEDFAKVVRDILPPGKEGTSSTNNKQESEKSMPPEDTTPTSPGAPADGGSNPIAGGGSDSPAPAADNSQQSTADEQAKVDEQVGDAMSATPAPAPSDSGLPADPAPAPDTASTPPGGAPPAGDSQPPAPAA